MKYFFVLLFMSLFNVAFSQNKLQKSDIKVKYILVMAPDSTLLKSENDAAVFSYTLLANAKKSIYADENLNDYYKSVRNRSLSLGSYFPKSKSSVYKDGDKVMVTLPIGRRNLYSFEEPSLKWEIVNNRKKNILSYECYLAKTTSDTGKIYYAWFAPSIPLPEGPFRFKGLGGLILEVFNERKNNLHYFYANFKIAGDY